MAPRQRLAKAIYSAVLILAFAFPQAQAQERKAENVKRFSSEISQKFGDPKRWGIAGEAKTPEGRDVVKLSDLLACSECVEKYARRTSTSAKNWILDHFLYRLVSAIGSQQANYGIYLNAPPETISVVIDPQNGDVEKFLFSDFSTAAVDPSDAILMGVSSDLNYAHEDVEVAGEVELKFEYDRLVRFNGDLADNFVVQRQFIVLLNEQIRRMEFQYLRLEGSGGSLLEALRYAKSEEEVRERSKDRRSVGEIVNAIAKLQAEAILLSRSDKIFQRLEGEPLFKMSDKTLTDLKALILNGQVAFTSGESYAEWKRFAEPGFFDRIRAHFKTPGELKLVHALGHTFIVNQPERKIVGYTLGDLKGLCEDRVL